MDKITTAEMNAVNVKSVSGTKLTGTATENKNTFDKLPELIVTRYNSLIDELQTLGITKIVLSDDVRHIRINADKQLETSADGVT